MTITDWIIASAVLVALFGDRIWRWIDKLHKKSQIKTIINQSLHQLKNDLNKKRTNVDKQVEISETFFSEISGYYFLFADLILPNMQVLNLNKFPKTIEFFNHYKINIEEIRNRFERIKGKKEKRSYITMNTFNKLIERLDDAINEFN